MREISEMDLNLYYHFRTVGVPNGEICSLSVFSLSDERIDPKNYSLMWGNDVVAKPMSTDEAKYSI